MRMRLLMVCIGVMLMSAGCNRGAVSDVQVDPAGGVDATVTLTEQEVNDAVVDALSKQTNPLLRNPKVDLQNGQILINGEHERRDGQGTVSGSVTVTITVQNGGLLAQVTQANIEGWDASDARVAEFNQHLVEGFNRRANRDNGQLTFKAITITDSNLSFTINIKRA
ncbi:MAG: DUF2993 domain-containing protein [Chloroflexi bacterium]|nr:DUF2993 domain-containing protein [Chloroflexota bacterium]MCC6896286.1 LmeA family phospholipid-binding protein [Anaerolineae bacterium]